MQTRPDLYDGSHPAELDSRVRNDLGRNIAPSTNLHIPLLPNFFMEVKGSDGSMNVLKRQVAQDAAFGARAMLEIQSYSDGGRMYDGNAYTIVSTYHSGAALLNLYAMHPTHLADPTGKPGYHMTQIRSFAMIDSAEACHEGLTWFRNSRDWAKELRDDVIASANEKVNARSGGA